MNSNELADLLSKNRITTPFFRGVCASDELIKSTKPYSFISNTDRHDQKGVHWNAWFIDSKDVVNFFDSFGRSPRDTMFPRSYANFVKNKRFRYNPNILESLEGFTCGHFCVFMLYYRSLNVDLKHIYNYFGRDLNYNDSVVFNFVKSL